MTLDRLTSRLFFCLSIEGIISRRMSFGIPKPGFHPPQGNDYGEIMNRARDLASHAWALQPQGYRLVVNSGKKTGGTYILVAIRVRAGNPVFLEANFDSEGRAVDESYIPLNERLRQIQGNISIWVEREERFRRLQQMYREQ